MVDHVTGAKRSAMMSRVRGRDTQPEKAVRSLVHRMGFRFRIGVKSLPGKPDLVLSRHRKIIFVHGCFWHQHRKCGRAKRPSSRVGFWNEKLDRNMRRDRRILAALRKDGWACLVVWECELRNASAISKKLRTFLRRRKAISANSTL
jgi:DNA mismatch endonuclease, patch repair protein